MLGEKAFSTIDEMAGSLSDMSRKVWENPEGPYKEFIASAVCADYLESQGFRVERGCYGIPTAFRAEWGNGHPVIGFLGEYDALPGQSQRDVPYYSPIENQPYGHGCGHNLLAVGMSGSAVAIKKEMEASGIQGTLVVYTSVAGQNNKLPTMIVTRFNIDYLQSQNLLWAMPAKN